MKKNRFHFCFLCRVKWLLIGIGFWSFQMNAQVLDNRQGNAFTDQPFFNQEFVRTNQLKQLKGTFVYKKRDELMKTTDFSYVYNFDKEGRLASTFETRTDDGTVDTTWNVYVYDVDDQLIAHRKTDQEGFTTVRYRYDQQGRVILEEHVRDFKEEGVEKTLVFNKEEFKYFDSPQQTKRTRLNSYGLPYLEEFFYYDESGYLTERVERIKMTSTILAYKYEYNENGLLSAIHKTKSDQPDWSEQEFYKYDELGNLIEKHVYKNGEFTTDIQIIYNSKSKLLATVITREVSTGFLMILRFLDYSFYE